jgi:hypothetical protein
MAVSNQARVFTNEPKSLFLYKCVLCSYIDEGIGSAELFIL